MSDTPPRPWFSLRGGARYRKVPERAVYAAARSGALTVYKFDSRPRVRLADLDAWIEAHRCPPGAPEGDAP